MNPGEQVRHFEIETCDTAGVGDHLNHDSALILRTSAYLFEDFYPSLSQRFGISNDMNLGHWSKILGVEEASNANHMLHRPATGFSHFAILHGLFFAG